MHKTQLLGNLNRIRPTEQEKILRGSENRNTCLEFWSIQAHMLQNFVYKIRSSFFTSRRTAWFSLCFCSGDSCVVIVNTPTRSRGRWTLHVIEATVRFALCYISVDFDLLSSEVKGIISCLLAIGGYPAQNWNIAKYVIIAVLAIYLHNMGNSIRPRAWA